MAYKKYIKRGGKIYGPYVYHSKRIDGKVVSEYMGPHRWKPDFKKFLLVFLGIFVLLMIVYFIVNFEGETTGRAVLNFDVNYSYLEGGLVEGVLNLSLQEEDFIPATSKLIFENRGNISEFYLADLISESEIIEKTTYPSVYFNLIIKSEEKIPEINEEKEVPEKEKEQEKAENEETEETESNVAINENSTEISNEIISNNESGEEAGEAEETANETIEETAEANENEVTEQGTESEAEEEEKEISEENEPMEESSGAPLTGEAIKTSSGNEEEILISKIAKIISGFFLSLRTTGYAVESPMVVSGDVSFNQDFLYNPGKGQAVENVMIESGSVRTDSKNLPEDYIEMRTEESKVIVTTNYSETIEGFFGKDLIINMSDMDITFVPGELKVKIIEPDSGKEIFSFLTVISEEGIEVKPEVIFLPEVIELTKEEREILVKEFGENVTVNVREAMEKNNLLVVKYKIANYEMIRSYELSLSKEIIESFMERDRIKFLKDIAMTLSRQEEPGKKRDEFLGEWNV